MWYFLHRTLSIRNMWGAVRAGCSETNQSKDIDFSVNEETVAHPLQEGAELGAGWQVAPYLLLGANQISLSNHEKELCDGLSSEEMQQEQSQTIVNPLFRYYPEAILHMPSPIYFWSPIFLSFGHTLNIQWASVYRPYPINYHSACPNGILWSTSMFFSGEFYVREGLRFWIWQMSVFVDKWASKATIGTEMPLFLQTAFSRHPSAHKQASLVGQESSSFP